MTSQTLEMNCTMVVDNGKANSIQMIGATPVNATIPAITNNLTLVVKDPALMGVFKAGKNYTVVISESEAQPKV
jgi:hypothetical protein